MAKFKNIIITYEFLDSNPKAYFIFGDNLIKKGYGGAAKLRDHPHALGFITKKFPDNDDSSFYRVDEYKPVFYEELHKLYSIIKKYPDRIFYISKLGEGLANRYNIWENLIQKNLLTFLKKFDNVVFCWDEEIE